MDHTLASYTADLEEEGSLEDFLELGCILMLLFYVYNCCLRCAKVKRKEQRRKKCKRRSSPKWTEVEIQAMWNDFYEGMCEEEMDNQENAMEC